MIVRCILCKSGPYTTSSSRLTALGLFIAICIQWKVSLYWFLRFSLGYCFDRAAVIKLTRALRDDRVGLLMMMMMMKAWWSMWRDVTSVVSAAGAWCVRRGVDGCGPLSDCSARWWCVVQRSSIIVLAIQLHVGLLLRIIGLRGILSGGDFVRFPLLLQLTALRHRRVINNTYTTDHTDCFVSLTVLWWPFLTFNTHPIQSNKSLMIKLTQRSFIRLYRPTADLYESVFIKTVIFLS